MLFQRAKNLNLFDLATVVWFLFPVSAKHPLGQQMHRNRRREKKKKKKDYGMTSNSRLIHQWVFPDIHVKTRFVKACGCTQVLLIICKGNWQQREHPKWLCSSETSEMHLPSLLIFSQCDHGACVCISQSLRFYLSTPLWCQGVLQFKKTQMHSLQVACSFTFLPNAARVYSVFSLSSR